MINITESQLKELFKDSVDDDSPSYLIDDLIEEAKKISIKNYNNKKLEPNSVSDAVFMAEVNRLEGK